MKTCWANSIGNCSNEITREHIISNVILDKHIRVKGFSWCQNEFKEIGSGSFVSNFLCKYHNNMLSPYDKEIAHFLNVFKKYFATEEKFAKYGFSINKVPVKYSINGLFIERWFLKTLINVALLKKGEVIIDFRSVLPILYGNNIFTKPFGLSWTAKSGRLNVKYNSVEIEPLFNYAKNDKELTGGVFRFHGHRFLLLLNAFGPSIINNKIELPTTLDDDKADFKGAQLNWHNISISHKMPRFRKQILTQIINFNW